MTLLIRPPHTCSPLDTVSLRAALLRPSCFVPEQPCRCAAVSPDSVLAFVAMSQEENAPENLRRLEDRQFRGSIIVPNLETLAETGASGEAGVCGCVVPVKPLAFACFPSSLFSNAAFKMYASNGSGKESLFSQGVSHSI